MRYAVEVRRKKKPEEVGIINRKKLLDCVALAKARLKMHELCVDHAFIYAGVISADGSKSPGKAPRLWIKNA